MKIALVQQKAGPDPAANRERGVQALREAAREGAKLAVFPELAFLPFFPQFPKRGRPLEWAETIPGPTTELFCSLAAELEMVIVLNLFESVGQDTFDSSPVIDSDGCLLGTTRMTHIPEMRGFHEQDYYAPGDTGAPVYATRVGRIGVAICYDRHYPEYLRALALKGAELVVVPQAGSVGEWPAGLFEAEMQVAGFQNGYFTALANRVGAEEHLIFAGESFVTDPAGCVVARAATGEETILFADLDLAVAHRSHARRHFLADRRPEVKF